MGVFLFTANTGAGVLAYALQIGMARSLSVVDYGLFAALLGIFNLTAIPLTAAVLTVTRAISHAVGHEDERAVSAICRKAARELTIGVGVLLGLAVVLSAKLADLLQTESVVVIVLLWIAVGANAATVLGLAVLQGLHRFVGFGVLTFANALLRLVCSVVAVAVGLGVGGAFGGFAAASMVAATSVWWTVTRALPSQRAVGYRDRLFTSRPAVLLVVSNLMFVAMTQFDYVLARVFLPAEQASQYAAASVLAKSVLWLPVGIVIAMFPMVASEAAASRPSRHLLVRGLGMAALTSGALAGILAVGAEIWVQFFYGPRFEPAAPYLAVLALAYLPMAIVLVVDNYQLALHRARFIAAYAAVAGAEVVALVLPGASPERLIAVLVGGSFMCLVWALWIVREQLRAGVAQGVVSRS